MPSSNRIRVDSSPTASSSASAPGRSPTTRRRCGRRSTSCPTAGFDLDALGLVAVGHRVVHGGPDLYRPTVVDDALIATLETLSPLAPLHNPPAILGIEVARKVLPDLPHVAVFDTAFFHDLPAAAATLRHRPRRGRAVAHSSVRLPRHVAPVRQRAGRRVPRRAAGVAQPDRAAPRQRGVGVGDRRRPAAGHVDGADADGGSGDGHPVGRHRPRRHHVPAAGRRA